MSASSLGLFIDVSVNQSYGFIIEKVFKALTQVLERIPQKLKRILFVCKFAAQ